MCSMLVSARGFRNEIDSCVVRLFHVVSAHALIKERGISLIYQGRFKS